MEHILAGGNDRPPKPEGNECSHSIPYQGLLTPGQWNWISCNRRTCEKGQWWWGNEITN